jgi:hypothetical protein
VIPLDINGGTVVKRHLIALVCALGVLLIAGTGVAAAQSVQGVEQIAGTGQSASSNASSTQTKPSNSNISVRIFSPGDGGSVTQENASAAKSVAGNAAETTQTADQSQSGGSGEQAVGQEAFTGQKAEADAESKQYSPSNSNISVRIHSPGDDGDVSQSNASKAEAVAGNKADTDQSTEQAQGDGRGKCCSGGGVQAVGQKAVTLQDADADAKSEQYEPRNKNISVRIGSKGDNGDVTQSNTSAAKALAFNKASTTQTADQDQSGGCKCGADRVQAVGQKAITGQKADADATSIQKGAENVNVPVRIFSGGDDGDVKQTNASAAFAGAFNSAETEQTADQDQGGGCKCKDDRGKDDPRDHGDAGAAVQAVGQWAETWQKADADATSKQEKPSNKNAPVRIKSYGDGGDVEQANLSLAAAFSLNRAFTFQGVNQVQ